MKSEILDKIAIAVSEVCEVSVDDIKSTCKQGDIVEARWIFVHFCYAYGFQPASITKYLCRCRKNTVNDCSANYLIYRRQSAAFRLMSNQVEKKLSELFPKE